MNISGNKPALLTAYCRNLRGGSQPILALASDGFYYVVKFTNNLQGPHLPFNEACGYELYRAAGLPVPAWKPLLLTDSFIDQNPNCWIQTPQGRLRPNGGLCFGSRFLGGENIRLLEILPGNWFKRVQNYKSFWLAWLIDICAQHTDNRQALFHQDASEQLNAFFIDHGHLFSGPKGDQKQHFLASRYLDPRIYQSISSQQLLGIQKIVGSLDIDHLWLQVEKLPDDWKTASALTGFSECLNRLSSSNLLSNIVDTMVEAQTRTHINEEGFLQNGRKPPMGVLCPGVETAAVREGCASLGFDNHACA